jgi:hypothetical protein
MKREILRTYDLSPDGVRIVVKWHEVQVGMSMFIPCINTTKAVQQINKITSAWGWDIETKVGVAGDKWGVRVWRIL